MRLFVAGKVGAENDVGAAIQGLLDLGHTVPYDWRGEAVEKPYSDHLEANRPAAHRMRAAIKSAEALVLVWSDSLLGGVLETGIALGLGLPVYVLDSVESPSRDSIYWCVEDVTAVRHLSQIPLLTALPARSD